MRGSESSLNRHSEQLYWHIMNLLTRLNDPKEVEDLAEGFWSKCIGEKWFAGVICRTYKVAMALAGEF